MTAGQRSVIMLAKVPNMRGDSVTRMRCTLELACAVAAGILAVLTFAVHDWIEVVFGVDPDAGSGLVEAAIVVILFVVCAALAADAFRLRRLARARA